MDVTQKRLISGLKRLISELECGMCDVMTPEQLKQFINGLSMISEVRQQLEDNGKMDNNRASSPCWLRIHRFFICPIFQSKKS